ncbi:LAGLIDADG family homing endonuclease [Candidatus Dojkabacteria bacterium]|uniref:LAGLIDADG family homing endonuclease n=1 Tax=Candidatus Dojkabacteria bacterium TaxID=2099670 RepID=A0A955RHB3_9BACT|nr:LAGLIDADG family homing endonuclease [Candidatus Dojkabacteria bacterium]
MKEQVKLLREKGLGINKIAKQLHIANYKVKEYLIELGLHVSSTSNKNGNNRKYFIDDDLFSKIDTEFKAYLLGLLYADGSVDVKKNGFSISLQELDKDILLKIKDGLNTKYPIHYHDSRYSKNHKFTTKVSLCPTNAKVVQDLIKLGCVPNKSDILKFPTSNQVPCELIHHFIRGYFDGDGTVYITNTGYIHFGIISTLEFCTDLLSYLPCDKVKISKENRSNKNVWYFTVAKRKDVKSIYDYLYKDATIYLQRKYDKFKNFYLEKPSTTIIETPEMEMV